MSEEHWLVYMAKKTAEGAVLSEEPAAIEELADMLKGFAQRQRKKLLAENQEN